MQSRWRILKVSKTCLTWPSGNQRLISLSKLTSSRAELPKWDNRPNKTWTTVKLAWLLYSQQKTAFMSRNLTITCRHQSKSENKCGRDFNIWSPSVVQKRKTRLLVDKMSGLSLPMIHWETRTKSSITAELPLREKNNWSTEEEILRPKWWKNRFMPSSGNLMLRRNLNVKCKKPVRSKRKSKIQWQCSTGKSKLDKFRGKKNQKGKIRNAICLRINGQSRKRKKKELSNKNSCLIVRETLSLSTTTQLKSNWER